MKIEKDAITFTGSQEIDDLKVALVMASNTALDYLRYAAENPAACFTNTLIESKNNMVEAISSMFATAIRCYRMIETFKNLVTSPMHANEMAAAKDYFSTIKEFCEREASNIRAKS